MVEKISLKLYPRTHEGAHLLPFRQAKRSTMATELTGLKVTFHSFPSPEYPTWPETHSYPESKLYIPFAE